MSLVRVVSILLLLAPCSLPLLELEVAIVNLVPGQPLLIELVHEGIGVELFDVVNAGLLPQSLAEHHGTNHGRYASGVRDALHTCLFVCSTV